MKTRVRCSKCTALSLTNFVDVGESHTATTRRLSIFVYLVKVYLSKEVATQAGFHVGPLNLIE